MHVIRHVVRLFSTLFWPYGPGSTTPGPMHLPAHPNTENPPLSTHPADSAVTNGPPPNQD